MSLRNQVILITGAGGGLGSTAALALAKLGAHIILLDKNIPRLEIIYDQILEANAPEPIIYPFDLAGANENEYEELAQRVGEEYGALQGLLHSAVEHSGFRPYSQITTKDWGHTMNVKLNAPFLLTRVLLPVLVKSEHASVVFTSDSSAREARAYSGAYGVSKVALEGLVSVLADELESGNRIRVNTLVPGPVDSPLRKRAYPAEDKSKLPLMNSLDPVYQYLFSVQSVGVTGQIINASTFHL